jgi:transcriptional regulator with XRE-family HTH domain
MTLQQVADETPGMTVGYLSEIETGKKPGSVDAYKALAETLNADISVLIPV